MNFIQRIQKSKQTKFAYRILIFISLIGFMSLAVFSKININGFVIFFFPFGVLISCLLLVAWRPQYYKIILFVTISLFICLLTYWGVLFNFGGLSSNTYVTFSKSTVIFPFSKEERQVFRSYDGLWKRGIGNELVDKRVERANEIDEKNVLVFFKLSCAKCKKSIPSLLNKIDDRERLIFINLETKGGKQLAKTLGVTTASTAVFVKEGVVHQIDLAIVTTDGVQVNQTGIEKVQEILEGGDLLQ